MMLAQRYPDVYDGVVDGVVSNWEACKFDPFSIVGQTIDCPDYPVANKTSQITLSKAAATVVNETYAGPRRSDGKQLWYGLGPGTDLRFEPANVGLVFTECTANGTCTGVPTYLVNQWIRFMVEKNADFDPSKLSHKELERIFRASVSEFSSIIGTTDADLSAFRDAGGKLLSFHGSVSTPIHPHSPNHHTSILEQLPSSTRFSNNYTT